MVGNLRRKKPYADYTAEKKLSVFSSYLSERTEFGKLRSDRLVE
jgi:hypothetical protein